MIRWLLRYRLVPRGILCKFLRKARKCIIDRMVRFCWRNPEASLDTLSVMLLLGPWGRATGILESHGSSEILCAPRSLTARTPLYTDS